MDGPLTTAVVAAAAATNVATNSAGAPAAAAAAEAACAPLPVLGSAVVHHASFFAPMADDSRASSKSTDESPPMLLDAVRANSDGPSSQGAKRPCVKSSSKSSMDAVSRRQYLERALHDVTSQNISIRKAATRYGLSKSSLCDFVRKNGVTIPNRRGRRLTLNDTPPVAADASHRNSTSRESSVSGERAASGSLFDGAPAIKRSRDSDEEMEEEEEEEGLTEAKPAITVSSSSTTFTTANNSTLAALVPTQVLTVRGRGSGARGRRGRGAIIANRGGPLRTIAPKSILRESPWNSVGFPTQVPISSWGTTTVLPILTNSSGGSPDNAFYSRSCPSPDEILLPPPALPAALSPLSTEEVESKFEAPNKSLPAVHTMSPESASTVSGEDFSEGLMRFIDASPSPYHAVHSVRQRLVEHGFSELLETDSWNVQPNGRYFVTKNQSTILAFAVGGRWSAGNGFSMVGAHTDSPCLKVKPVSDRCGSAYIQMGVETYGGGIWYTWFDRDLSVAGRVIVRTPNGLQHRLVHLKKAVARVPSLCIHLNRSVNEEFRINKEYHMTPILCTTEVERCLGLRKDKTESNSPGSTLRHPPSLLKMLSEELQVEPVDLVDLELCLTDTQPSARVGIHNEFICGPRMDNLFNTYAATEGLVAALPSLPEDPNIRIICLYDNEEVGSESAQGAASAFTEHVIRRLSHSTEEPSSFERAIGKSYMLSADQGHAVHPNYEEKHEREHKPVFNKGMILKMNSNQRYASNAVTGAIIKEIAREAGVPMQEFVVRQDTPCGSTIGPIQSARLGVATMDIGGPTLSMHSIREMVCAKSVNDAVALYTAFFKRYPQVFGAFSVKHD